MFEYNPQIKSEGHCIFGIPSILPSYRPSDARTPIGTPIGTQIQVIGTYVCNNLCLLQLFADSFETSQVFNLWSEGVRIVWI